MGRHQRGWVPLSIGLAGAIAIAWRILSLGLADYWAPFSPERALAWRPSHGEALEQDAEQQLAAHRIAEARKLAIQSVEASPLDGRGYRIVAATADVHEDQRSARRLLEIAALRSPRDLPTHMKLAEYALKSGDIDQALHQLDLVLRIQPDTQNELLPRMAAIAEMPVTTPALVRMLSRNPPWRTAFLQRLTTQARHSESVSRIYRRLQADHAQTIPAEEMGFWIDRLIREHDWSTAYVAWASSLPEAEQSSLGNIFDANFIFPPSGNGFGWRITPAAGADVHTIKSAVDGAGAALAIEFNAANLAFRDVSQLMVLSPGRYVLRGRAQSNGLDTARGLQWVLTCAEGSPQVLASSPLLVGTQPWSDFSVAFEVPPSLCGGQWLRLQMGAPDRISGHAAYTKLSVERVPDVQLPNRS